MPPIRTVYALRVPLLGTAYHSPARQYLHDGAEAPPDAACGPPTVGTMATVHHPPSTVTAPLKPIIDLPMMGDIAQKMVRDSLESLVRRDCELANHVLEEENKVDALKALSDEAFYAKVLPAAGYRPVPPEEGRGLWSREGEEMRVLTRPAEKGLVPVVVIHRLKAERK